MFDKLAQFDPEITAAIRKETERQEYSLEFIASENFVSEEVLAAQGSVLTNKYAEGYPSKRYYGGCEFVDVAEDLAINRAKATFRCGTRQRSGSLRFPGQYGGLLCRLSARRYGPWYEPRPRWAPDSRLPG